MDNSSCGNTCEMMESREEIVSEFKTDEKRESSCAYKSGKKYSVEDDINILFQASLSSPRLLKSALRRPIKASSSQTSRTGISEPASLKQAFRGLCISQASEMAALKRLSKSPNFSRVSEAGTDKNLYTTIVDEGRGELVEISLVSKIELSDKLHSNETHDISSPRHSATFVDATNPKTMATRLAYRNKILPLTPDVRSEKLVNKLGKQILENLSSVVYASGRVLEVKPRMVPTSFSKDFPSSSTPDKGMEAKLNSLVSLPSPSTSNGVDKSTRKHTYLEKPIFKDKTFLNMKVKQDLCSSSIQCTRKNGNDLASSACNLNMVTGNSNLKNEMKENEKLSPSHSNHSIKVNSVDVGKDTAKAGFSFTGNKKMKILVTKTNEKSISKDEFSQNSESSICEYSSCTSNSEESSLSGSNCRGCRPHMSKHLRWEAIHAIQQQHGNLSLRHFKLLRRLGCGDIGTVYLTELVGTSCHFALKVMDNEFLASGKKVSRAQTEKEILQMLDHPFLPTVYAHIATDKLSCLVMEYCPGGDLHVLRQRQSYRSFSEQAARFYTAEVLLALEYLHMLGVVYRNLKPENILVREDGHIMLTDFDLSLRCSVNAMLVKSSSPGVEPSKKMSSSCSEASRIHHFCLQPNWQVPCFTPILSSAKAKSRKMKADIAAQVGPLPQLVVEPTSAHSTSLVGTYEYLAPEIIKGEGHGSAVDWWTFGIFLFELLYGKTPFKEHANEDTLANVMSQNLKFPDTPIVSFRARDLIRRLLIKDPKNRLGSVKGATEIKQHSFFEGLNWALIRCAPPPELPRFHNSGTSATSLASHKENVNDLDDAEEECEQCDLF